MLLRDAGHGTRFGKPGVAPGREDGLIYRSPSYRKEGTRELGNIHLHVDLADLAGSEERLVDVAAALDAAGWPCKVTRVARALPGSHIRDAAFSADYAEHTPELAEGLDTFAAYVTAQLCSADEADDAEALVTEARRQVSDLLRKTRLSDVVVEIERVCARIEGSDVTAIAPIALSASHHRPVAFEAHHFVDLDRSGQSLDQWTRSLDPQAIAVGGWFQFEKPGYTAFRSVRFYRKLDLDHVVAQHSALRHSFDAAGSPPLRRLETVIEQILDLWRL